MHAPPRVGTVQSLRGRIFRLPAFLRLAILFLGTSLTGCAALTNPVKNGIPASAIPAELLAKPKDFQEPLPVSFLGQKTTGVYRLAAGDTLGVWIEGVLSATTGPPVYQPPGGGKLGPRIGYPIPVLEDGTVALPLVAPISVKGLTVQEAEAAIRKAFTVTTPILAPGRERIIVNLLRQREYHVIVFRDEAQNFTTPARGAQGSLILTGTQKRGNGHAIDLSAGENDVLHALANTGGPPGNDAYNEVVIDHKSRRRVGPAKDSSPGAALEIVPNIVRIPLYVCPKEPLTFTPEDIILDDGDTVYLQARDIERYYTGGLLPPGEFILPRDYDLDVVTAISTVRGPLVNGAYGGFGGSGISGALVPSGLGAPSPSLLTILRRTPQGNQVCIRVDLKRALCGDMQERILIRTGDVLILQETPAEAMSRYAAEFVDRMTFNFSFTQIFGTGVNAEAGTFRTPGP